MSSISLRLILITTLTIPTLLQAVPVKNESQHTDHQNAAGNLVSSNSRKKELSHLHNINTYQFADSPILNIKTLEPQPRMIHKTKYRRLGSKHQTTSMILKKGDKKGKYNYEKDVTTLLSPKKKVVSNPELFSELGLTKLRISPAHNRKRLAVESRHHGRPDDSHMFVIKLPPNPYYYGNMKPALTDKNSIDDKSRKIPVGFKSNGKPGRIYHWNIPVLKKIIGTNEGRRNPNSRHNDDEDELLDIKHIPTWSKSWENDVMDKGLNKIHHNEISEKLLQKKSPTYYGPKAKQNNFQKFFPGNGKPESFYVIDKKNHKPRFHKLIA